MTTGRIAGAGRLRMTGYAVLQVLLSVLALVLFIVDVVAVVLSVIVVGIPILLLSVPATRWLVDLHRRMYARVLAEPVPTPYQSTAGTSALERLRIAGADPMSWRDLGWLLSALPLALTTSLVVLILFVPVVTGIAWWYGVGPIMAARSRIDRWFLAFGTTERLEQRVETLTETRNQSLDHAAAELRRIERDLHDGAQARLAGLGMTLGMAAELVDRDPDAARRMLAEARQTSSAALGDLRDVVHGIHPPVLADRGLKAAIEALALDLAVPVEVTGQAAATLAAPVESAAYFTVAECLANVAKHAGASRAWVELGGTSDLLSVVVGDDGHGGADPSSGSGMRGVARRLAAFDGTMRVSSPTGGPTLVTLEVPCDSSSPRTTPSSGRG
ncbi:MAG TPA: sensor domain-containing protein [Nocardioides sp.]|nr:sensor domain-containing protein [Nocardioides sp.]